MEKKESDSPSEDDVIVYSKKPKKSTNTTEPVSEFSIIVGYKLFNFKENSDFHFVQCFLVVKWLMGFCDLL